MDVDNLSKFGPKFQIKAITAMLVDKPFLDQAQDIIDPKYFDSRPHEWVVQTILEYFRAYKDVPTMEVFKKELDKVQGDDTLVTGIIETLREVYRNTASSDIKYISDEFLTFCKNQSLKTAIMKSADKLNHGDYDGIKKLIDVAMRAGADRDYGHDWNLDIEKRLVHMARITIPTGWTVINQIMDGGLGAGELGVIVAPPGIGKSWALASIGKAVISEGKKVAHYTLELNENYLGLRYDSLLTGIESNQLRNHVDEVRAAVEKIPGHLKLKYFPTRTVSITAIRAHLEQIKNIGFDPDIVIVDYGDLLRSTDKFESRWQELGAVYEDLRGMAGELEVPIWTASQSQRSSVNEDIIEGDKIAESFNKIMTADFIMSISRKMPDKITNTARIHIIKNRFGIDGVTFPAMANFVEGKFEIYDEASAEGIRLRKQMNDGDNVVKAALKQRLLEFSHPASEDLG